MGDIYKMYNAAVASADNSSAITMPKKCRIKCVLFQMAAVNGAGAATHWTVELSRAPARQVTTSDTRQPIASCSVGSNVAATASYANVAVPCDVDVDAGAQLYLNTLLVGTAPSTTQTNVYLMT